MQAEGVKGRNREAQKEKNIISIYYVRNESIFSKKKKSDPNSERKKLLAICILYVDLSLQCMYVMYYVHVCKCG